MSTELPSPPLDYANARPAASRLHCEIANDHTRVWRDPPPRAHRRLVIDFVLRLIMFIILGGWIVATGALIARTGARDLT